MANISIHPTIKEVLLNRFFNNTKEERYEPMMEKVFKDFHKDAHILLTNCIMNHKENSMYNNGFSNDTVVSSTFNLIKLLFEDPAFSDNWFNIMAMSTPSTQKKFIAPKVSKDNENPNNSRLVFNMVQFWFRANDRIEQSDIPNWMYKITDDTISDNNIMEIKDLVLSTIVKRNTEILLQDITHEMKYKNDINLLIALNEASAHIYSSTSIGSANKVLYSNDENIEHIKSFNRFKYIKNEHIPPDELIVMFAPKDLNRSKSVYSLYCIAINPVIEREGDIVDSRIYLRDDFRIIKDQYNILKTKDVLNPTVDDNCISEYDFAVRIKIID